MNWTIFNFRFRREQDQTEGSSRTSFKVGIGKLTVKPPKATSRLFPAKGGALFPAAIPLPAQLFASNSSRHCREHQGLRLLVACRAVGCEELTAGSL